MYGIRVGISLLGFILFCVLARWYKRRVRGEDYNAQTVVEEVYNYDQVCMHAFCIVSVYMCEVL